MELENIIVIIIFSLLFLAAFSIGCSVCLCNTHKHTILPNNVQIFPTEQYIELNITDS